MRREALGAPWRSGSEEFGRRASGGGADDPVERRRGNSAGVDEQTIVPFLDHRCVEVAEDDDLGIRKLGRHRLIEEIKRGGIVGKADVAAL